MVFVFVFTCAIVSFCVCSNRIIPKKVNLRIEHVKHSSCREDFLKRVKLNEEKKMMLYQVESLRREIMSALDDRDSALKVIVASS